MENKEKVIDAYASGNEIHRADEDLVLDSEYCVGLSNHAMLICRK